MTQMRQCDLETFVLGGGETSGGKAAKILEMDTSTSQWSVITSMANQRKVHQASIIKLDFKTIMLCK